MTRLRGLFLVLWLAGIALARATEPLGSIDATIEGPTGADKAWAVELQQGLHIEGKVTSGRHIHFGNLPLGTWCLVLRSGSHFIEGLRFPDEVYVGTDLAGADLQACRDEVLAQEAFFDKKELWSLQGGNKRAVAFVFNERAKDWYDNPTGSIHQHTFVRRYDIQIMRKSGASWLQDKMFFLEREMPEKAEARPMTHQFNDRLCCIELSKEKPDAKIQIRP